MCFEQQAACCLHQETVQRAVRLVVLRQQEVDQGVVVAHQMEPRVQQQRVVVVVQREVVVDSHVGAVAQSMAVVDHWEVQQVQQKGLDHWEVQQVQREVGDVRAVHLEQRAARRREVVHDQEEVHWAVAVHWTAAVQQQQEGLWEALGELQEGDGVQVAQQLGAVDVQQVEALQRAGLLVLAARRWVAVDGSAEEVDDQPDQRTEAGVQQEMLQAVPHQEGVPGQREVQR